MNQRNYQKELEKILQGIETPPNLFLHSCCAPCSSYVLEYLCPCFRITVFYFNPNISSDEEYRRRAAEQKRLIAAYNKEKRGYPIAVVEGDYQPADFYTAVKGYEHLGEGSERCFRCFDLRLRETAFQAQKAGSDYFGTTLTISPLKNAVKLNEIGEALSREAGVRWLPSDFKKRNGFKRSTELSAEYGLYRQNYCGCSFSKEERMKAALP
ncbi:MAG: epoxyqueuosine reductase QueH [Roseburia sp.]|nr:epoxyqueuosine reductase QueH [Roseburia sp.]